MENQYSTQLSEVLKKLPFLPLMLLVSNANKSGKPSYHSNCTFTEIKQNNPKIPGTK